MIAFAIVGAVIIAAILGHTHGSRASGYLRGYADGCDDCQPIPYRPVVPHVPDTLRDVDNDHEPAVGDVVLP